MAVFGSEALTQRRCPKNSGGGIAPAAIGGLIEGAPGSVNVFQTAPLPPEVRPERSDKSLKRLNFPESPGKG